MLWKRNPSKDRSFEINACQNCVLYNLLSFPKGTHELSLSGRDQTVGIQKYLKPPRQGILFLSVLFMYTMAPQNISKK